MRALIVSEQNMRIKVRIFYWLLVVFGAYKLFPGVSFLTNFFVYAHPDMFKTLDGMWWLVLRGVAVTVLIPMMILFSAYGCLKGKTWSVLAAVVSLGSLLCVNLYSIGNFIIATADSRYEQVPAIPEGTIVNSVSMVPLYFEALLLAGLIAFISKKSVRNILKAV